MKILLTGFEPFAQNAINPSQKVVETLATRDIDPDIQLIPYILPVVYTEAELLIRALIRQHRPDVILALGLAETRTKISLERVALNLDDAAIPDNAGELRQGTYIRQHAPNAYFTTLPLEQLKQALETANIPVQISNHAGAYLCNHVFFAAIHEIEQLGSEAHCCFIHIPLAKEFAPDDERAIPFADMVRGIEICIQTLCRAT